MPGHPKRIADRKTLANIVPSFAAEIYAHIAAGKSIAKVAEIVDVSKYVLTEWLESPDRIDLYKRARAKAATALAEQTIAIADTGIDWETGAQTGPDGVPNIPDAARIKNAIQARQWLSSRWDREQYGEAKAPAVQINLGSLHIDALRRASRGQASRGQAATQPVVVEANPVAETD